MMLLSEYLENNDLFGAIESVKNYAFISPRSNLALSFKYGERVMVEQVNSLDVNQIAELLVYEFDSKWSKLLEVNFSEMKLNSGKVKIITDVSNDVNTKTSESGILNKVSGLNDESLIVDTGSTNTGSDNLNAVKNYDSKTDVVSLNDLFNNLKIMDKTNIINCVLDDITNYLTTYIY